MILSLKVKNESGDGVVKFGVSLADSENTKDYANKIAIIEARGFARKMKWEKFSVWYTVKTLAGDVLFEGEFINEDGY